MEIHPIMYESGEKQYYYKITHELQCCVCMKMLLCHVFRCVEIVFRKDLGPAVTLFTLGQWVWESLSLCKIHRALLVYVTEPVWFFTTRDTVQQPKTTMLWSESLSANSHMQGGTVGLWGHSFRGRLCIVPLEAGTPSSKLWQSELFQSLPDVPSGVEWPCLGTLKIDAGQSMRGSLHTKGCHDSHISRSRVLQTSWVPHGDFRLLRTVADKSCFSPPPPFSWALLTCHQIIRGPRISVVSAVHFFRHQGSGRVLRLLYLRLCPNRGFQCLTSFIKNTAIKYSKYIACSCWEYNYTVN